MVTTNRVTIHWRNTMTTHLMKIILGCALAVVAIACAGSKAEASYLNAGGLGKRSAGAPHSAVPVAAHVVRSAYSAGGDTYTVMIVTGTRNGAGTHANVRLEIYGPGCV